MDIDQEIAKGVEGDGKADSNYPAAPEEDASSAGAIQTFFPPTLRSRLVAHLRETIPGEVASSYGNSSVGGRSSRSSGMPSMGRNYSAQSLSSLSSAGTDADGSYLNSPLDWMDHLRISFLEVFISLVHGVRAYIRSWAASSTDASSSSSAKGKVRFIEAGFDAEGFLKVTSSENTPFVAAMLRTSAFYDFVRRSAKKGCNEFNMLVKAGDQDPLPRKGKKTKIQRNHGFCQSSGIPLLQQTKYAFA